MKKTVIFLAFSIISSFSLHTIQAQGTDIPGGNVSGVWNSSGSPYLVNGDITIPGGDTLTIESGVSVEFQGHYKLTVYGTIFAIGAINDTIVFTVNDPTDFDFDLDSPIGSWGGIKFYNTTDSSKFYCCKFQFSKEIGTDPYEGEGGALYTPSGVEQLMVKHCHFYNNYARNGGGAIGTRRATFIVEECRFTYNKSKNYGGAIFGGDGELRLYKNYFAHNQSSQGGAIGFWGSSNYQITGNHFVYNTATSHGGAIHSTASTFKLTNNIIANNYASSGGGGIHCSSTSYPILTGNLIVNNTAGSAGGGIYLSQTNAISINNTICNNAASTGAGIASNNSIPEIHNTILYGNQPTQIYLYTNLSYPNIYYSDIEGGIGAIAGNDFYGQYENNVNVNPQFADPSTDAGYTTDGFSADWSLPNSSPCINGGNPDVSQLDLPNTDVYGNQRIRNNIIDIGAAETHIDIISVTGDITGDVYWFGDTIKIYSDVIVQDDATLRINAGTVIQFQDYYQLTIQGQLLAQGKPNDTILFTVHPDKISTGWAGLEFENSSGIMFDNDSSIIDHCRFEYAKKTNGGAIQSRYFSNLLITNSTFMYDSADYKGGAVHIDHCSPVIRNNLFSYNHANRGALAVSYGSPLIIGNTITHNTHSEYVGGIFGWWSNFIIQDNYIANNKGGIYAFASNTREYVLINNIIVNNESSGASFGSVKVYAQNNTIVNNNGCGLCSNEAKLTLINTINHGNNYNNIIPGNEPIRIYNCNIQGGWASMINGSTQGIEHEQNIDSEPHFLNPTTGKGWDYESVPEDWKIYSISPCINTGTIDNFGYTIPLYDILGQPRINSSSIDIGAVENQSGIPEIVKEPVGGVKCSGDSITLSISVNDTVYYQWQRDGQDIPGATMASLTFDSLTRDYEGNYNCIIQNSFGTANSNVVLLIVKDAPDLLLKPESQWVKKGDNLTYKVMATGTRPIRYQWFKDGDTIPGAINSELKFLSVDYSKEGVYHCNISNVCGAVETDPAILYVAPEICMVTVDTVTGKNFIVWEKQTSAPLLYYNIYKESVIAGQYDLIGTILYDDLSVFIDTAADPTEQAYWYKITGTDTSGFETDIDLCHPHKTIHLLTTRNPETGATQLDWDKYIGFDYGTFHILRSTTESNFSIFHSMASSTTTWADVTGGETTYYYRVAVQRPETCFPTSKLKAGTGTYSHSMSNMEDNRLKAGEGNNPPEDITLTDTSIVENQIVGSLVGRFETVDPDTIDSHTYTLVSGQGDTNNNSFTIIGNLLVSAEIFDYETKNEYSIRIRSTDSGKDNLTVEKVFAIAVTDAIESPDNQAPTDLSLDDNTIAENQLPGILVGRFTTIDPDTSDIHSYTLVQGTGADDNNSFTIAGDLLLSAEIFDYETKDTYAIRIRSTDNGTGNLYIEETFTVIITDLAEAPDNQTPTDITLSSNTIDENQTIGSFIGRFSTSDPDTSDLHAYHLVHGTGDEDNSVFSIAGDLLLATAVFDFEIRNSYSIRVRSTDNAQNYVEEAFTININDVDETVGIRKISEDALSVYPNPFNQTATIIFPNDKAETYRLYVMDLSGKVVKLVDHITTSKFILERGNLDKGYYLIEMRGPKPYRGKLIVE